MSIRLLKPLAGLLACAGALLLFSATAVARTRPADLRVLTTSGKVLADQRQYTSTVHIRTDPDADCFGPPGGSGQRVKVRGATALGLVRDALESDRRLRPLSVTDQFGFGLGVCGIGGFEASGSGSWYLKRNHHGAQVGGDQLHLRAGDEILWYLAPSFPYPPELVLRAPARALPGQPFTVRVLAFGDDGKRAPVQGATVNEASAPTDAEGQATIVLDRSANLRARHSGDIPSNIGHVCVAEDLSGCPAHRGKRIFGSRRRDRIHGTAGPDRVRARGGRDVVRLRGGERDRVNCGAGHDRAVLDSNDRARKCEQVVRR
jgi:hypothetical protein